MTTSRTPRAKRLSKTRLDRLVEEAIVDCYNESEQVVGLYTMIENNLALPFETMVLGVAVAGGGGVPTPRGGIVAGWWRARGRPNRPNPGLPMPSPGPTCAERNHRHPHL